MFDGRFHRTRSEGGLSRPQMTVPAMAIPIFPVFFVNHVVVDIETMIKQDPSDEAI
jgi:hypothetical protein